MAARRIADHGKELPACFFVIAEGSAPIEDGILAIWNTSELPLGLYTVRLVMDDERLGTSSTRVQVLVVSAIPPTPTVMPPATPEGPDPDG